MIIIDSIQMEIINTIKLLIYKENPGLLEKIDFDDDRLFLEPLLFAYFNYKSEALLPSELLTEIMQGYFVTQQEIIISHSFKNSSVAYLPKLGYFKKGKKTPFDEIGMIENTNIEILKYPVNLLQNIFRDFSGNLIPSTEIICDNELVENNLIYLTNAISLIKENSNEHFKLIEICCQKILLFKTDTNRTNSFAAITAHGIAFLNVYQDDYDEVFFVDDIAHQTGHIILTTLFYNRKTIFKIDDEQNVEDIIKLKDHRTIYILLHALYTYFTTFLCLDNCLKNDRFKGKQKKEAIGRIGFYLKKCTGDLDRFKKINTFYQGIENVLTLEGMETYNLIEEKYMEVFQRWDAIINVFDYSNQTYNFAFKNFNELN
ncbi:hypothetical protein [Flavobacterium sp. ov086]|uniref:hypothetical protein n=1 Tax=Flavobacterium sp. ov086 TaxID=1761785 RepID=UPI000B6445B2|nr:hypothetical protein [Flavobacterium sp. ov086]SNR86798.1 hypothetical protein SAMN04487979_12657 [Flavobacterium sp. ov086]